MLYDDPLTENRASDEAQTAYAEAIRAGAAARERVAGAGAAAPLICARI